MARRHSRLLFASLALLSAYAGAVPVEVVSNVAMELRLRGDFVRVSPENPVRYRVPGSGRLILHVAVAVLPNGPLEVELTQNGASVEKLQQAVTPLDGIAAKGAKPPFVPQGFRRVAFALPPAAGVYEVRVNVPSAISAFRESEATAHARAAETPLKPEGKAKPFTLVAEERWHWASVCDRVTVHVPGSGVLRILARTQLDSRGDLPPPSYLRAVEAGHARMTTPITAAAEPGFEFGSGRIRYGAGTQRELTLSVPAEADYDFELAAWGCVNGVGLQFDFSPGPTVASLPQPPEPDHTQPPPLSKPESKPAKPVATAKETKQQPGDEMAQCLLLLEDVSRARVAEYLDTMMASGLIPSARVTFNQNFDIGSAFAVNNVSYVLDGMPLFEQGNQPPAKVERQMVPGPHTLEIRATLRGQGMGQFKQLSDTTFRVSRKETFVVEAGRRYKVGVTLEDRGGFTTPMKDRPAIGFTLSQ